MANVLIIGASRGIGRELVRQYLADGARVLASARKDDDLVNLSELGAEPIPLDVSAANDWAGLGWKLDGEQLDIAIYAAGVYGPSTSGLEAPADADFDAVMHTNVQGAMRFAQTVAPMLVAEGTRRQGGRLAVISSRMGAMAGRSEARGWLYRASKAALNSVLVDTALSLGPRGAICITMHPGWVRTDMGGAGADLSVEQSAAGIRGVIAGLTPAHNGAFLNFDGSPIPW